MKLGAPRARFLCLEPSLRFASALRRTVRANGWRDVRVEQLAAGAEEGARTLYVNATTASVVAAAYGERQPIGAEHVAVTTLDRLLAAESGVAFIKVDTDGFDLDVLLGARGTIERHRPMLYFELDPSLLGWGGRDVDGLIRLLDEFGYDDFVAYSPIGQVRKIRGTRALRAAVPAELHVNVLARP
jgi:FkbM family methyltransferase